jgi:hypothetical protein
LKVPPPASDGGTDAGLGKNCGVVGHRSFLG